MTTKLVTPPVTLVASLVDVRADLRDPDVGLNNQIESFIVMATGEAERYLGRAFMPQQWRVTLDEFPRNEFGCPGAIMLDHPPIISVESIKFLDAAGALQTLDPADYVLDKESEPGWIVIGAGKAWPVTLDRIGAVTVDYTCGYAVVPQEVKMSIRARVGEMFGGEMKSKFFPECLHAGYKVFG
jgi:uncharacterized phiE125 gp8 family phage protein